jgi:acetyl esterase/lipase
MTPMPPFRLSKRIAVLLLAYCSSGTSLAGNRQPEVKLWPVGSRVLQDGIRALADEKWALTHPSFLLYSPKVNSTRSAILIFPGGGYKRLAIGPHSAIGLDGADVCKWLTDAGITCILLKYRVPQYGVQLEPGDPSA